MIKDAEIKDRKHEKETKKENWRKVNTKPNMKFYNEANKREKQGNK